MLHCFDIVSFATVSTVKQFTFELYSCKGVSLYTNAYQNTGIAVKAYRFTKVHHFTLMFPPQRIGLKVHFNLSCFKHHVARYSILFNKISSISYNNVKYYVLNISLHNILYRYTWYRILYCLKYTLSIYSRAYYDIRARVCAVCARLHIPRGKLFFVLWHARGIKSGRNGCAVGEIGVFSLYTQDR